MHSRISTPGGVIDTDLFLVYQYTTCHIDHRNLLGLVYPNSHGILKFSHFSTLVKTTAPFNTILYATTQRSMSS